MCVCVCTLCVRCECTLQTWTSVVRRRTTVATRARTSSDHSSASVRQAMNRSDPPTCAKVCRHSVVCLCVCVCVCVLVYHAGSPGANS